MEDRGLTDTEVQSGMAGAQYSNTDDGDTTSLDGGGDPPEEEQTEGAQGSGTSRDSRNEEKEGASLSLYLAILSEPANHAEDILATAWVGDGLAGEVSRSETSPVSKASELDTSADSGLTRESEGDDGQEDGEVTDRLASSDTHTGAGQLSRPSRPTDRSEEDSGTVPADKCHAAAVRHLSLDQLRLDTIDVKNMAKCLTPDFSDREVFFDLVWEVQSRRINDQRCSFRRKIKDRRAYRSVPSSPLDEDEIRSFFPSMSSLQTEEFFDLIVCSQSRRLDDQRADFEDSPILELGSPFPEQTVEYLAPVGRTASPTSREEFPAEAEDNATERGHSPTEGKEPPAEEEEVPAERDVIPAEREEAPAEREEAPAERGEAPAEREEAPAEKGQDPAEREEIPAEKAKIPAEKAKIPAEKKEPDDELYNTIMTHQSASARIEDQRSQPPAYSSKDFFDLLERVQERRMDEQRAVLPPGLAPKREAERGREERRASIFSPLLKGMSQRRANSS